MSEWTLIRIGFVQGLGLGFIFVPLTTIAFSTLPPLLRTEAAGMFSLMRNLGSSIGVSIVTSLLVRYTQVNHETLARFTSPYAPQMQAGTLPSIWNPATARGLAALNDEVTRQASLIAYLNDFRMMMYVTLAAIPMVLLRKRAGAPPPDAAAALERAAAPCRRPARPSGFQAAPAVAYDDRIAHR